MNEVMGIWRFLTAALICFIPGLLSAQVEEAEEITTEMVEDAFQENFFEALKQKGIGNYDKALQYLSECKQIEPGEPAVDYELGRIYLHTRQYSLSEDHLLSALYEVPSNIWYLNATVQLYLEQQDIQRAIDLAERYREQGAEQQLLIADLYIRNNELKKAEELIAHVEENYNAHAQAVSLRLKLMAVNSGMTESAGDSGNEGSVTADTETPDGFRNALQSLAENRLYDQLLEKSTEAISNFPAQPEFYYFKGLALLKTGNPEASLEVSREGMAYLLDDNQLELAFYQLMKEAYGALGNDKKRKEIENKIGQKGL